MRRCQRARRLDGRAASAQRHATGQQPCAPSSTPGVPNANTQQVTKVACGAAARMTAAPAARGISRQADAHRRGSRQSHAGPALGDDHQRGAQHQEQNATRARRGQPRAAMHAAIVRRDQSVISIGRIQSAFGVCPSRRHRIAATLSLPDALATCGGRCGRSLMVYPRSIRVACAFARMRARVRLRARGCARGVLWGWVRWAAALLVLCLRP